MTDLFTNPAFFVGLGVGWAGAMIGTLLALRSMTR